MRDADIDLVLERHEARFTNLHCVIRVNLAFFLVWECLGFNVKTKLDCWGMDEMVGRGEPQVLTS